MTKIQKELGIDRVLIIQGEISPELCIKSVSSINSASNFSWSIRGFVFSKVFFSINATWERSCV